MFAKEGGQPAAGRGKGYIQRREPREQSLTGKWEEARGVPLPLQRKYVQFRAFLP